MHFFKNSLRRYATTTPKEAQLEGVEKKNCYKTILVLVVVPKKIFLRDENFDRRVTEQHHAGIIPRTPD